MQRLIISSAVLLATGCANQYPSYNEVFHSKATEIQVREASQKEKSYWRSQTEPLSLTRLDSAIKRCRGHYAFASTISVLRDETVKSEMRWATMSERTDMYNDRLKKSVNDKRVSTATIDTCVSEAKAYVSEGMKAFVESFVSVSAKDKAKSVLAQWETTLDNIDQDRFEEEESQYKTLVNSLKIDLAVE